MSDRHLHSDGDACDACPLAGRRTFLRDAAVALAGIGAALALPDAARALPIRFGRPLAVKGDEHSYPIPATDSATIDHDNEIIVVRFQQKAYGFNLSCPHQHTALRWDQEDMQFQCPRHHSRYQPDGIFISGRATRGMDRFGVSKDGDDIVVDVAKYYRQDQDPTDWNAAFITLS